MYKWVEVDLDAIASNYQKVKEFIGEKTKILGVVKADAYGHGLVEVAKELERNGINYLGVTEVSEGVQLRKNGIEAPILVFGPFLPEDIYYLNKYELTASISSIEIINWLLEKQLKIKAHLKIETGMGRTGLKYDELLKVGELLQDNNFLEIEGIYTHLATAMWKDDSFLKKQYKDFIKAVELLENKGLKFSLKHICNSSAIIKFPEMHLDMVRAGTILYGQGEYGNTSLKNSWSLKAQITYITNLPKGHSIGYERTYILKKDSKIAVVPIGFYHGFSVEPIPKTKKISDLIKLIGKTFLRFINHPRVITYARIKNKEVPVIGKVGMQLSLLDISGIPDVKIGDIVELPGRRTNISTAIPRVYVKEGTPIKIRNLTEKFENLGMVAK